IVDASFVDVPKQRNSREENQTIKNGVIAEEWKSPKNESKLKQKDTEWNKVEHRLFSYITKNWQGKPLIDVQTECTQNHYRQSFANTTKIALVFTCSIQF
ncbi:MAG: hypothetical protein LBH05_05700, partial [Deferribacteraceae bacterium]|nr:hypothetical protein [Deferribacteraceae bacterium]